MGRKVVVARAGNERADIHGVVEARLSVFGLDKLPRGAPGYPRYLATKHRKALIRALLSPSDYQQYTTGPD